MTKKPRKTVRGQSAHKENIIQRAAEQVEERLIEGAEMATETTSAETNVALAALRAITGGGNHQTQAEAEGDDGKQEGPRPENR
jgi:hypothetical protein